MPRMLSVDEAQFSSSATSDLRQVAGFFLAAWAVLPGWFHLDIALTYSISVIMLVLGLSIALKSTPAAASLSEKFVLCGTVLFAVPMAVFGTEHFLEHVAISKFIPSWVPAHLFFTYLVGAGLIAASLSIVFRKLNGLAAACVGIMFFCFEAFMHIPIAVKIPHNRNAWVILARDFIFGWGALALAATYTTKWKVEGRHWLISAARLCMGGFIIFCGVQHFLHPEEVPGFPLRQLTPAFIPAHLLWGYLTGIVYMAAGVLMLIPKTARLAAMWLGLFIICMVMICSVPFMIQSGGTVAGLNVPLDNLMLSGAVLCLAGSLSGKPISQEEDESSQRVTTVVTVRPVALEK